MARDRLLIVTSTWPAAPDDGTPAFVLDLAVGLATSYDVTVIAPRMRGAADSWPDIEVIRFAYFFKRLEGLADGAIMPNLRRTPWRWLEVPSFLFALTWRTVIEARRRDGGIISAQWILPAGLAAVIASKLSGLPFVVTVHGADAYTLQGSLARRLKALILRAARAVFPVSSSVRDQVLSLAPNLGTQVISEPLPMGIRPVESAATVRSHTSFLFVGRLAEKKGLDVAIRALALTDQASLRVVGDGPLSEPMKELATEVGVADRVQFLGRRSRTEVLEELATCAALVIPSIKASDGDEEGTPVVLAEGLASGASIVASRIGGLTEHIRDGHNGYLVPPGDIQALADRLRSAIADPRSFHEAGTRGAAEFAGSPLDMNTTVSAYIRRLESLA